MDHDEELHKAWVDACMDVAHDFATDGLERIFTETGRHTKLKTRSRYE